MASSTYVLVVFRTLIHKHALQQIDHVRVWINISLKINCTNSSIFIDFIIKVQEIHVIINSMITCMSNINLHSFYIKKKNILLYIIHLLTTFQLQRYIKTVWTKIKTKTKTGFSLRSFILNFALYYDLTFSACWMSFSPSSVSCWLYAEISELRRVSSNCLNARAIKLKSMSASFRSISESADLCARRQKKISNLQVFINLEFFEICRLYF